MTYFSGEVTYLSGEVTYVGWEGTYLSEEMSCSSGVVTILGGGDLYSAPRTRRARPQPHLRKDTTLQGYLAHKKPPPCRITIGA